jgi:hypothetical protein
VGHFEWFSKSSLTHSTNTVVIFECICIFDNNIKQWLISPLWQVPVVLSHIFSFTVYARAWWSAFMHPLTVWIWWHISEKGVHLSSGYSCELTRLTEWDKCIEFLDNLHCTSKQCFLPHMPTVIPLFTCVNIDYTSKMGGVWVTLEYGLFFLNCYEWCKFPFTQWSVDIIVYESL